MFSPPLHEDPEVVFGDVELVLGRGRGLRPRRRRRAAREPAVPQALRRTGPRPATRALVTPNTTNAWSRIGRNKAVQGYKRVHYHNIWTSSWPVSIYKVFYNGSGIFQQIIVLVWQSNHAKIGESIRNFWCRKLWKSSNVWKIDHSLKNSEKHSDSEQTKIFAEADLISR